jgi:formylglycine-generating enzyme required for sulfatase activity/murein DD-endopeptidase MepM/ murein hydrolase activator NlpD
MLLNSTIANLVCAVSRIWLVVCTVMLPSGNAGSIPKAPNMENRLATSLYELGVKADLDYKDDAVGIKVIPQGAILRAGFQRLAGTVTTEGLWLESTSDKPGRLQVVARSLGRDGAPLSIAGPGTVAVCEKVVTFNRPGLTEEYSVSVDGVRQDFVIGTSPAGSGALRVDLAVAGATAEASAEGIRLTLAGSQRILAYNRLQVVDASGRVLNCRMEVPSPNRLTVVVEDNGAIYPVRIDPTFSDSNWSAGFANNGPNGWVYALAVSGTDLYAGGEFTTAGGVPANRIAKWNGSAWSALGGGTNYALNSSVSALAVNGTNLYAGGWFASVGRVRANHIAMWNGTEWSALGEGMDGAVSALAVSGTNLYVGGGFTKAGGVPAAGIAMWNGYSWSALGRGVNGAVSALAVTGAEVFAAVSVLDRLGVASYSVNMFKDGKWSRLGSSRQGMDGGGVSALAVSGTNLYVGGGFTKAGGVPAAGIAMWNGYSWSALGKGVDGSVHDLAVNGTDLYAGGAFTTAGGVPAAGIAMWNGYSWSALGKGVDGSVAALAVSGRDLYVGGNFTKAGLTASSRIAQTVAKSSQSINFGALADKTTGDPVFDLFATASSGLPTSFSIVSGPAIIEGKTLALTGAGTVVVRASQAGDATYSAAASVDRSFTVRKLDQSIAFGSLVDQSIGYAPFTLMATASSGLPIAFSIVSGPAVVLRDKLVPFGTGIVVVRASQVGDTIYAAAVPVDRRFTVRKLDQSLTFGPLMDKSIGDAPFPLTADSSSGLPIVFSIVSGPANIVGNTITLTGAGTVVVRASQAGNERYSAATPVERTFTVGSPLNQELPVELGVRSAQGNSAIELVVPKSSTAGVIELFGAGTLESLVSQPNTIQFTNAPTGGDLLWRVPVEKQAFYRALLRAGKTLEDYSIPDWDEPVDPTNRVALVVAGVPEVLASGSSFTATLVLTRSDLQIVPLAATGRLRILSWQNGGLHPDATVEPSGVRFTNGIAVVRTTIQAITSLEGFTVGIEWADAAPVWPGPASRRGGTPAKGSTLQLPNTPLGCLSEPDLTGDPILLGRRIRDCILSFKDANASWGNPLPEAANGVARAVFGSFGEWRGHKRKGVPNNNVHVGLDLLANKDEKVRASRGGWLTEINGEVGGNLGRYVTINHLDGTYSRYLHLQPWSKGDDKVEGDAKPGRVERNALLGRVGLFPGMGTHLHFEIRRSPGILSSVKDPGVGVDPVREAGLFPVGGLDNPPVLESFQVVGEDPAKGFVPYAGETAGLPAADGQAYVIIRVRQKRFDDRGAGLSPRGVQMRWEGGGGPVGLDLTDEEAVRKAMPAEDAEGRQAGFAIYEHGEADKMPSNTPYRYWFRWDASRYASEPNGARTLTLTATSYAPKGMNKEWQVKWGPEIELIEAVGDVEGDRMREYRIQVKYWRGHQVGGEAESVIKGHDWYEYQLSEGGVWLGAGVIEGGSSKTKDLNGTDVRRYLHFKMPIDQISKGWVRVASGRVPLVAHLKKIDECSPVIQPSAPPDFMWIPSGKFMMGSPKNELQAMPDETQHEVELTKGFFICKHEVTQEEYQSVAINNPSFFRGANLPVEQVSWFDSTNYCGRLTLRERQSGRLSQCWEYRLPTEAQWEYACRAGSTTATAFGDSLDSTQSNFYGTAPYNTSVVGPYQGKTTNVGNYKPNKWGLYDMHGNVWEWCADWYGSYPGSRIVDPQGPSSGTKRVRRGGSWNHFGQICRSANRFTPLGSPGSANEFVGFRVVLVPVP